MNIQIIQGDSLEVLQQMESESINCVITSPPYYGLRDYGTGIWEGGDPECPHYRTSKRSDKTITGHKKMVDSGHPVGDAIYKTVCPLCGAVRVDKQIGLEETPEQYVAKLVEIFREVRRVLKKDGTVWLNMGDTYCITAQNQYKSKDLIGIPWQVAFALRNDGWYLRQDIIWHKPNPMPESASDRCTKSHEYIFLLSKTPKYYFNFEAIKEPCTSEKGYRRKRDVWTIATKPYKEAHFATFPEELVAPCLLAGCPEQGTALDLFAGAGTVGVVCKKTNRNFIGIELNPEYISIATTRILKTPETLATP